MKTLLVAAALGFVAVGAMAQGQFTFGNKNLTTTPPIDARVFDKDGVTGLNGTAYWTQAYVKLATDPDSSYAPVGTAVNFRTGNNAGYIVPVVVTTTAAGGGLQPGRLEGSSGRQADDRLGIHAGRWRSRLHVRGHRVHGLPVRWRVAAYRADAQSG